MKEITIKEALISMLEKINPNINLDIQKDYILTDSSISGDPTNFVYLIIMIKEKWNIEFNNSDFINYKCNSLDNLTGIIAQKVN